MARYSLAENQLEPFYRDLGAQLSCGGIMTQAWV